MNDPISRRAAIDALHTWFRDGFDEDKWWNSTHVLAAIEGIPSAQQGYKWETCFECPLSHGCPKIKGCTNEQAIEYASQIPNDCPLSAQPDHIADIGKKVDGDCISRQATIYAIVNTPSKVGYHDNSEVARYGATFRQHEILDIIERLSSIQPEQVCVANVTLTDEQVKEVAEKAKNAVISVIEPEPHWIPCSKKLPEYNESVLTWDGYVFCIEKRIPYIRDDDGEPIEGDWWVGDEYDEYESEFYPNLRDGAAIAWMPLPDPYEGGGSE